MSALGLYHKAFKAKKLYLLYRDKVQSELEAELNATGALEYCSDDTILDFVDCKTDHLVLMFNDEKRIELLSKGIDVATVDKIIIPKLAAELNKWNDSNGALEALSDTAHRLKIIVEQPLLAWLGIHLDKLAPVYARHLLKTLALVASWAPENEVTAERRKLRAELLAKAETVANRIAEATRAEMNTESLRREYLEFKWICFDLALSPILGLGRIVLKPDVRLVMRRP